MTRVVADYELFALNTSDMRAALNALGLIQNDGSRSSVRYAVQYYGAKYTWDGVTTVAGPGGYRVKSMVAQPGVYAIIRWATTRGDPFPPAGVVLPAGATIVPLPANSPVKFFG